MFIALGNSSGDPDLAMAITDCMLPHWSELAAAVEPIPLPDGLKGLTVTFGEGLPRTHFQQARSGPFLYTLTGIDKQHFLTKASPAERRDYLFDLVEESLQLVEWPAETRQKIADRFRLWRATLPTV